jgi:SIR2-like domain
MIMAKSAKATDTQSAEAAEPAAAVALAAQTPIPDIHDAVHQARLLREALQSDKVRIGYFIGAGCPLGIYDEKGEKSLQHIPDVAGLTKNVHGQLSKQDDGKSANEKLIPIWDKLAEACKDGTVITPNVEHILSELRTLCGRRGKSDVDGMAKERLALLDTTICDLIAEEVGKALPIHRCAYHRFASWVGGLQRVAPVELFTPNYDLLLEEAFEQQRIPHFDGFVGAREPFFDLASIEQDAIPARWTRLWKLHGSINWQKRDDGGVFRVAGKAAEGKAMIYPSHLKYDQSRRMPYLAMLDRLKAFFRTGGHAQGFGPPVLVVCGYSFCDEHLNEVLLDGLRGNRSAQCFVLAYSALAKVREVVALAETQPNLSVIALDGAVVGTRKGYYRNTGPMDGICEPWHSVEQLAATEGKEAKEHPRCHLGDFHFFGLFLEQLCGGNTNENTQHPA